MERDAASIQDVRARWRAAGDNPSYNSELVKLLASGTKKKKKRSTATRRRGYERVIKKKENLVKLSTRTGDSDRDGAMCARVSLIRKFNFRDLVPKVDDRVAGPFTRCA